MLDRFRLRAGYGRTWPASCSKKQRAATHSERTPRSPGTREERNRLEENLVKPMMKELQLFAHGEEGNKGMYIDLARVLGSQKAGYQR